jgi:hypothetical protein
VEPGPGVEEAGISLLATPYTLYTPGSRSAAAASSPAGAAAREPLQLEVVCQSTRWGHRVLGPATVAVTGP